MGNLMEDHLPDRMVQRFHINTYATPGGGGGADKGPKYTLHSSSRQFVHIFGPLWSLPKRAGAPPGKAWSIRPPRLRRNAHRCVYFVRR